MITQDIHAMESKAIELLECMQSSEARRLYEEITTIAPDNADARNRLCKLNVMQGRYEQAEPSCRKAATLLSDTIEPLENLANTAELYFLRSHNALTILQAHIEPALGIPAINIITVVMLL